jgi:TPR repeat protein
MPKSTLIAAAALILCGSGCAQQHPQTPASQPSAALAIAATPTTLPPSPPATSASLPPSTGSQTAPLDKGSQLDQQGRTYRDGTGVAKDDVKAVECFQAAADLGNIEAMSDLGFMYFQGRGVPKDPEQGGQWVAKALDKSDPATLRQY